MTSPSLTPPPRSAPAAPAGRWPFGATRRALWLLVAGLLWTIPAWWDARALVLLAAWDFALAVAWAYDVRTLPAPHALRVTRLWDGPPALGIRDTVTLRVESASPSAIAVRLLDTPATELRPEYPEVTTAVGPRGVGETTYDVLPSERGDATIGDLVFSYQGGLGLALHFARAPLSTTVTVYPDLREAQRLALSVVRMSQLDLERRRAKQRKTGREFESLRDYREGDELRDICWTATARRGRLVTRTYQPEQSQTLWLIVDAGRLTRARVRGHRKLDHAANAALALAQVSMAYGDRVGLIAYGRRPQQRLAPGRGPRHLRAFVDALAAVRGESLEGDHLAAASELLMRQSRRSLVVWLTEIAETAGVPEVIEGGQQLARRHLVLLTVPQAVELNALAADTPVTTEQMYRVMAAQQTAERRVALIHSLRQRGVLALEWAPGHLSTALVDRYLQIKDRGMV